MRIKILAAIAIMASFTGIEQTSYATEAEPEQKNNKITEAKEPLDATRKWSARGSFYI